MVIRLSDIKELKHKKKEIILNLDEDEIEAYIMSLSQKYYVCLIKSDVLGLENAIESLKNIRDIYDLKYPDIDEYINYCLVISSNNVLQRVFNLDCSLWKPIEKSVASSEGLKTLAFSIEESRKKIINENCNVKEVYDMVISDENIDEKIVEKITDLYLAFKPFDYGDNL